MSPRFVAWMKRPGEPGLGCSVAIKATAEDAAHEARCIAGSERWRSRHPETEVTITRDPVRQIVVQTFMVRA